MEFIRTSLQEEISVQKLISLHYFEFAKDYMFQGETHDFWELVYVDQGEVEVMADSKGYTIKQGEIIFHKPNEFHNLWANNRIAPNVIVIAFECHSPAIRFFENRIMRIGESESRLIANLLREGIAAFAPPLDMPGINTLTKNPAAPFGAEQLVKLNLELLLIQLYRKGKAVSVKDRVSSAIKERSDHDLLLRITNYMDEHIAENLSIDKIAAFACMGRTQLKSLFRSQTGQGVMQFFNQRKIEKAKIYIREEQLNLTEISRVLGYESIHYFSRHFKKAVQMAPSAYAKSVKSKL